MIFIVFFALVLLIFFDRGHNNKILFYVGLSLIILLEGLRWGSGADFDLYYQAYKQYSFSWTSEIGYWLIFSIFYNLGLPFTILLLFLASFQYYFYSVGIRNMSKNYLVSLIFIFVGNLGLMGNSRQMIAVAIFFFSVLFLVKKQYSFFFLFFVIACLFHRTIYFTFPIVFLNRKINLKILLIISGFVIVIALNQWVKEVLVYIATNFNSELELFRKIKIYSLKLKNDDYNFINLIMGLSRRVLPIGLLLFYRKQLEKFKAYNLFLNTSFLSLFFYLIGFFGVQLLLGRFTIYFTIFECIIYSWIICIYTNTRYEKLVYPFFLIYAFFIMLSSIKAYPELFIPYKTVFFIF